MKMMKLTDTDGRPVWVNPDGIVHLIPSDDHQKRPNGARSVIVFRYSTVYVTEAPEDIVETVEACPS